MIDGRFALLRQILLFLVADVIEVLGALTAGFDHHLVEPIDPHVLRSLLASSE